MATPILCNKNDDETYPVVCNNERCYKFFQFNETLNILLDSKNFIEAEQYIEDFDYLPIYNSLRDYKWYINRIFDNYICYGYIDVVKWFLDKMGDYLLTTLFHCACRMQNIEIAKLFINKYPNLFTMEVVNDVIINATDHGRKIDMEID